MGWCAVVCSIQNRVLCIVTSDVTYRVSLSQSVFWQVFQNWCRLRYFFFKFLKKGHFFKPCSSFSGLLNEPSFVLS